MPRGRQPAPSEVGGPAGWHPPSAGARKRRGSRLLESGARRPALTDAQYAIEWQIAWTVYRFYQQLPPPLPWTGRRQVIRTISIDVAAPVDDVFAIYSDVDNHVGRHPFLVRSVHHADFLQEEMRVRNFTALEDIPIAGVPVRSDTHAQQRIFAEDHFYETDSWTAPNVVTHQLATFEALPNGGTRVTERLVFEADLLLIDFTVTNGVAAHRATMAAMKEDIEDGVF